MEDKNNSIDYVLSASSNKFALFVKLVWFHAFLMVENHIIESEVDEIVVDITQQNFTNVSSSLHELLTSEDFSGYVCSFFGISKCTPAQRAVAVELQDAVYTQFLERLKYLMNDLRQEEVVPVDVESMSGVGQSKIRHVGGWAVRKVLNCARKYIQKNVYTKSSLTLTSVRRKQVICELLELVKNQRPQTNLPHSSIGKKSQPYVELEETSKFPETLEVTEGRRYHKRGLLHISDEAYLFFLQLEKRRVELLNRHLLKKERDKIVEVTLIQLKADESLKRKWYSCFHVADVDEKKVFGAGYLFLLVHVFF